MIPDVDSAKVLDPNLQATIARLRADNNAVLYQVSFDSAEDLE